MVADTVRSTAPLHGRPLYPMLVPFPIACFAGTLVTDLVYWRTAEMMWADFSAWLVTAGVILGFIAAIAGLIDFLGSRFTGEEAPTWTQVIGNVLALLLAVLNMLVHTHDAWTSVVPWGLVLSALVVVILVFTGWIGWSRVRHRYGVGGIR